MSNCEICGKKITFSEDVFGIETVCKSCTKLKYTEEGKALFASREKENKRIKDENNRIKEETKHIEEKKVESIKEIPFVTSEAFSASRTIKTLSMARGSTVRAKHIGRDFMAEVKNIVGGEVKGYTELLAEGREEAIYRMQADAVRLGANAVVCVRFTSSTIGVGIAEILAYGTAVIIEGE